jgi:hypothetical protein
VDVLFNRHTSDFCGSAWDAKQSAKMAVDAATWVCRNILDASFRESGNVLASYSHFCSCGSMLATLCRL